MQSEDERERDGDDADHAGADRLDSDADGFDDEPLPTADRLMQTGDSAADAPLDVDYAEETFHHDSATDSGSYGLDGGLNLDGGTGNGNGTGGSGDDGFESMSNDDPSLHEHLIAQAGAVLSGPELMIAAHLIDLIDEMGYLTGSVGEIADRLGATPVAVETVLRVIQGFDPSGVGARVACRMSRHPGAGG